MNLKLKKEAWNDVSLSICLSTDDVYDPNLPIVFGKNGREKLNAVGKIYRVGISCQDKYDYIEKTLPIIKDNGLRLASKTIKL